MSNQRNKTFRLSLIRRRIVSLCQSRALRAALLAALNGGPDAALVVEMVESQATFKTPHSSGYSYSSAPTGGGGGQGRGASNSSSTSEPTQAREAKPNPTSGEQRH